MPYQWPANTDFALWELDVVDRDCPVCGRQMYVSDHRYRHLHTLDGPVELLCRLNHCPDRNCPGHRRTKSPELEATIAPPRWAIGWDVFCWTGQRRFPRHRSITEIQTDLRDDYGIPLSDDALAQYARRYQVMLAARQQDPESVRRHYHSVDPIVLSIDGLQPEKGHETLYVVRELTGKRVWLPEALLSATADEVRRLIAKARAWADALGKPVAMSISDRQDAFVTGIAAEFPGVPDRYCDIAMRGFASSKRGRHWCMRWTRISRTADRSRWTTLKCAPEVRPRGYITRDHFGVVRWPGERDAHSPRSSRPRSSSMS